MCCTRIYEEHLTKAPLCMLIQISKHLCTGSLSNVLSESSKANVVSGTCQILLWVGKEKLQARRIPIPIHLPYKSQGLRQNPTLQGWYIRAFSLKLIQLSLMIHPTHLGTHLGWECVGTQQSRAST